ncbi:MAG TPA: hypothetical protein VFQ61_10595 [Polyangiaceae bacterium]|nr:hypothetical protein [Polyangiaceae bacterium]
MVRRIVESIQHERDFKVLCDGLLRFEFGHLVQTFASAGADRGVDAEYHGLVDGVRGRWLFQYKFRSPIEGVSRRRSWLGGCYLRSGERKGEFDKPGVAEADGYLLLTNIPVTVGLVGQLRDAWLSRKANAPFCVWDPSRLNVLLKGREHLARSWTGAREAHCQRAIVGPLWAWIEDALRVTSDWSSDPLWPLAIEDHDQRVPTAAFHQSFVVRHGVKIQPRVAELRVATRDPLFRYAASIAFPNALAPLQAVDGAVKLLCDSIRQEIVGVQRELGRRLPKLSQLREHDPQEVALALAYCVLEVAWGFPGRGFHSVKSGRFIANGTKIVCEDPALADAEPVLDELVGALERGVVPETVATARTAVEGIIFDWAERMYEVVTFGLDAQSSTGETD